MRDSAGPSSSVFRSKLKAVTSVSSTQELLLFVPEVRISLFKLKSQDTFSCRYQFTLLIYCRYCYISGSSSSLTVCINNRVYSFISFFARLFLFAYHSLEGIQHRQYKMWDLFC